MEPELLRDLLAEARIGHLATVGADGDPHVVPVCFVLEGERVYWAVDHKPKASRRLRRLANLRARPVAELVVDHYAEDWAELWWVRVHADAAILEPGDGPVVRLAVRRWAGWSAASATESVG